MQDITPEALATRRRELAMEYKKDLIELGEIKKRKAFAIIELLDKHKTVSKAELYYNTTPDGQKELELSFKTKGILELCRAAKTEIDILNAESFNQY